VLFLCLFVVGCTEPEPNMDMFNDYYIFTEYGVQNTENIVIGGGEDQYQFYEDTQMLRINYRPNTRLHFTLIYDKR